MKTPLIFALFYMLYKLERRDRNLHTGGLAVFDCSDIPSRRRKDLNVMIKES